MSAVEQCNQVAAGPSEIAFGMVVVLSVDERDKKCVVMDVGNDGNFCGAQIISVLGEESLAIPGTECDREVTAVLGSWPLERIIRACEIRFDSNPLDESLTKSLIEGSKSPSRPLCINSEIVL